MLKVFILAMAVCAYASVDVTSFESGSSNLSIPNIRIKNNGSPIADFSVYYYFSAADSKNVVVEPYFLNGGEISIEKLSANQYRAKVEFKDIHIDSLEEFPAAGYLQIGLHYADWSSWKTGDDFSGSERTASLNENIVVISSSGVILAGDFPTEQDLSLNPNRVAVYSLSEGTSNYGRYRLYAKNEGNVPVTGFRFDVEITADHNQTPVVEVWNLPNATHSLENLGDDVWALHFDVENVNLDPGAIYPNEAGFAFGIHYADWSELDLSNDYSLADISSEYAFNEKIAVYVDGKLVSGNPKIHGVGDIRKVLADENGYSLEQMVRSTDSLLDGFSIPEVTWNEMDSLAEEWFVGIPNFDSTAIAFFEILAKFPGLDTLFLASNYRDVREVYAQVVRLRMVDYFNSRTVKYLKRVPLKSMYSEYDVGSLTLTSGELWLLLENPMKGPGSVRAYNRAKEWSKSYAALKCRGNEGDTRADAFRHSVWNALLCRETGTQFDDISECLGWSKDFTDAHEENSKAGFARSMDFHNNTIGRYRYSPKLRVACEWNWFGICVNHEVVGPSREKTKQMYSDLADEALAFNDTNQLERRPWLLNLVYFRDSVGKRFCLPGETRDCSAFEEPQISASKIAVLKGEGSSCKDSLRIYLDLEDSNNGNKIISGDPNPLGISVGNGGVTFSFCTLDLGDESIPRVPYDYVVLRMDKDCPEGTYAFRRHHDAEDDDNGNSYSGELGPNVVTKNVSLEFCFVPADLNSTLDYPFSKEYGVFANFSTANIVHSEIRLDDEDSHNANSWNWYDTPSDIQSRITNIINGKVNTIYNAVKWIELVLSKILVWLEA
ncbi:DUF6973 domain-containing protein [Fibrobacter intestinalis]|uniref:DUF6973 domain-containing protein n=1 Tax=Fibrobacter intestinalis TaxID=28122 RepID=A0A1T4MEG6_9BACT|nr:MULTISPECIES: hypothetical protein [Fibrobacter]PBC74352.1 hypothetical protein BGW94_2000 [Fibrobacter sp. NR9]SJZ65246.1 hypothetical protein SAMN02745108_01238 [Fibrobacter intestinalis]